MYGTDCITPRCGSPRTHYAFCVHGPNEPQKGHRFDASVPLIDPYARALSARRPLRAARHRPRVSTGAAIGRRPSRGAIRVIYELHVKGFTRLHPAVPEKWRGKYLGLTVAPVIEHLKSLGVTAVELLPCQAFISEQFLLDRKLQQLLGLQPGRLVRAGERVCRARCRRSNSRPW